jgi:hypothetical protein
MLDIVTNVTCLWCDASWRGAVAIHQDAMHGRFLDVRGNFSEPYSIDALDENIDGRKEKMAAHEMPPATSNCGSLDL